MGDGRKRGKDREDHEGYPQGDTLTTTTKECSKTDTRGGEGRLVISVVKGSLGSVRSDRGSSGGTVRSGLSVIGDTNLLGGEP